MMFISQSQEFINMFPYMTKATLKMIKLRMFRWRNYAALSRWPQYNHKGPYMGLARGSNLERRWLDNKIRDERVCNARPGSEDWGQPPEACSFQKPVNIFSQSLHKWSSPVDTFFRTSDLQYYKVINLCCLKLLSFVVICYGSNRKLIPFSQPSHLGNIIHASGFTYDPYDDYQK